MKKPLISIVIPIYNEALNIANLFQTLLPLLDSLKNYEFEVVVTDNHSTDSSYEMLIEKAQMDSRIRVFRFSKNFGYQKSIYSGYLLAKGAAAIQLDADLQDPPEMIEEFLTHWQRGYQVVYGIRVTRKESFMMSGMRKIFYRLLNSLSEDYLPLDAGDFRLIDRCIIDEMSKTHDMQPFLRGFIAQLGFKQVGIPYKRQARALGQSNFSFADCFRLAMDGITSNSTKPLRYAVHFGLSISALCLIISLFYIAGHFFYRLSWPAGFTTTTVLILFSTSINALFLGILGEYVGRIFKQVKRQPITVIESYFSRTENPAHQQISIAKPKQLKEQNHTID